jgi:hypothetical protein
VPFDKPRANGIFLKKTSEKPHGQTTVFCKARGNILVVVVVGWVSGFIA